MRSFSQKILISTNSSCNLKCIYCFEKNKHKFEFDINKAITIISNLLSIKTEFGTKIKIHGGEPFLVFEKIRALCESLWEADYPEYFQVHITTNGTLVHGEIQKWLYKNRDRVILKLSIDGDKKSNDINRPNSFNQIDLPFFVKTWPLIVASMTITPKTLPYLYENIRFLHKSGFRYIVTQLSLLTDWSKYNLQEEYYYQITKLTHYYLDNPHIHPFFSWINIEDTLYSETKPSCGIGHMKAYDFQSNQYFPCQMCFPSACGNKTSSDLQKINFKDKSILTNSTCSSCPFINICVTCYAENYISRGDVAKRDMNICSYQKCFFAAVFKFEYARILKENRPTTKDIMKMTAILKWQKEISETINCFMDRNEDN